MAACREAFLGLLESDDSLVMYGVTSGYGQMARLQDRLTTKVFAGANVDEAA